MPSTTTSLFTRAAAVLLGLGLRLTTTAQTAPAWVSAHAVGQGSSSTGATAVDAAGNTYEAGSFNSPTFVVDGVTLSSLGGPDGYLAKYTPAGTLAWIRQLGSSGTDAALGVALDAAGNAYVTGFTGNAMTLGNNVALNGTTNRTFVVRYTPQGTPEWAQQSVGFSGGSGIGVDATGTLHLAGQFSRSLTFESTTITTVGNATGVFLARFSAATGALQSLVTAFSYVPPTGTGSYQYPLLALSVPGEVYVVSGFNQPINFSNFGLTSRGANDVMVAKYSVQGAVQWVQQFGGPGEDRTTGAVADAAGSLYVTGFITGPATFGATTLPGAGDTDGCLVKYQTQGTQQWVQLVGGPGSDGLGNIRLDAAGNPYVVGNFSSGAQLGALTLPSAGSRDLLVAAYTPLGQVRWAQTAGGPGFDSASSLGLDTRGDIYLLGRFANTCTFGPLALSTGTSSESFLARLGNSALATQAGRPLTLGHYPNPAHDQLHLSALPLGTTVQLIDALGRVVRETAIATGTVSVRGLAPGLYTLCATDTQGQQYTSRVAVE
jgi:hypothetical protein